VGKNIIPTNCFPHPPFPAISQCLMRFFGMDRRFPFLMLFFSIKIQECYFGPPFFIPMTTRPFFIPCQFLTAPPAFPSLYSTDISCIDIPFSTFTLASQVCCFFYRLFSSRSLLTFLPFNDRTVFFDLPQVASPPPFFLCTFSQIYQVCEPQPISE